MYLLKRFTEAARTCPGELAVVAGERSFTRDELDRDSDAACRSLQAMTAGERDRAPRIAIALSKSYEAIVAIVGSMKAGTTFVPLNLTWPPERQAKILRLATPSLVVCNAEDAHRFASSYRVATPEEIVNGDGAADARSSPQDVAYIIFTSGSTGEPKGVQISFSALDAFAQNIEALLGLRPNREQLACIAELSFDQSVMDWVLMLLGVGPIHLLSSTIATLELVEYVRQHSLTYVSSVGTTFALLASYARWIPKGALDSLRTICCGGSAFHRATARELAVLVPGAEMFNLFGPTEATVYCGGTRVDLSVPSEIPTIEIGVPFPGQKFLFDVGGEVTESPRGECELLLMGTQLMTGYLGAETGLVTLLSGGQPQTAYRTGDLVLAEGGRLYFVGRKGGFVKSRGYRVSPQEVENAFLTNPRIKECAALGLPDPVVENVLVLCFVTHDGHDMDDAELESHGASQLAPYSIPQRFVRCDRIPKSSSGKVDLETLRQTLREIEQAP